MQFEDKTVPVVDVQEDERIKNMTDAYSSGNEQLIYAFEVLAKDAHQAALEGELGVVAAALGCIEQLCRLGFGRSDK